MKMDGHHTSPSHKLYTLEYVAGLFTNGEKVTPKALKAVEQKAKEAGCYIAYGDMMFFRSRDIDAFLDYLTPRGTGKAEPQDTDMILMVVFGHRLDVNAEVFVGWCWSNGLDDLLDSVRLGSPGVHVLEFRPCTYGAYKLHREHIKSQRFEGNWYSRTPEMNAWLLSTFATGENDNDGQT